MAETRTAPRQHPAGPAELREAARRRFHAYFRIHADLMRLDARCLSRQGLSRRDVADVAHARAFGPGVPETGAA